MIASEARVPKASSRTRCSLYFNKRQHYIKSFKIVIETSDKNQYSYFYILIPDSISEVDLARSGRVKHYYSASWCHAFASVIRNTPIGLQLTIFVSLSIIYISHIKLNLFTIFSKLISIVKGTMKYDRQDPFEKKGLL